MPVFSRVRDGVLVVTADGDYTSNELRRVGFAAFESADTPNPAPVLLDLSGAAGLTLKSDEELHAAGAFFGAYRDRISKLAVVAPAEVLGQFGGDSGFAEEAGVEVRACGSHDEAKDWLGVTGAGS